MRAVDPRCREGGWGNFFNIKLVLKFEDRDYEEMRDE